MKTINKFSGLLLLTTAILLCSYMIMNKGGSGSPAKIPVSNAVGTATVISETGIRIKTDSTIKTRTASCACGRLTATVVGPDPARVSMCNCPLCQRQTGSAFSLQATFPKEQVTIKGKSTSWKFPEDSAVPVTYRNCSRTGVTLYLCPVCGSTVYYVLAETPGNIGIKVGAFADPTFPAPMISGFEEYRLPWVSDIAGLPMPGGHHN